MYALPIQNISNTSHQLNAWFQYGSLPEDGFTRLRNFLLSPVSQNATVESRSSLDFQPLSNAEEQRWKILERKAKQENLTGQDAAEHEVLLAVKFYHRLKAEEPHLSHMQLLEIVRQSV
jgi:hypothetical protein